MGDYTPVNSDMAAFTMTAGAAITGGQLVSVTGTNTVSPSAGGDRAIGVAAHDAPSGGRLSVYILGGQIHEAVIKNTSVLAPGGGVIAAASGQVDTATIGVGGAAGTLIGIVLAGGTGNGTTVKARFYGI
jgi:hypothetical protein